MRREQQQKYIYFFRVIRYGYTYTFHCVHRFNESINSYENRSKIQLRMKQIMQEISAEQTSIESKLENFSCLDKDTINHRTYARKYLSSISITSDKKKGETFSARDLHWTLYYAYINIYI